MYAVLQDKSKTVWHKYHLPRRRLFLQFLEPQMKIKTLHRPHLDVDRKIYIAFSNLLSKGSICATSLRQIKSPLSLRDEVQSKNKRLY